MNSNCTIFIYTHIHREIEREKGNKIARKLCYHLLEYNPLSSNLRKLRKSRKLHCK